jgi:hypothetical protein
MTSALRLRLKENFHQFTIFRFHKEKEMVTFRKSLLLLAIVAMMAAAGSAQVGTTPPLTCTANAGVPPIVRAEGLAELVGDVVLQCTGGIPTLLEQPVPRVNFRVFLNTTVTSKLLNGNWNEALLMVDEPQYDNPATPQDEGNGQRICTQIGGCTAPLGIGKEPGVNYKYTDYNVWQGVRVTNNVGDPNSGNTVEWLGVPIDPPGTQAVRIIRITNIRANAAERGIGSGLIPTQLTMFISATGSTGFPITNPTVQVGFIQAGLEFDASGNTNFLQCEYPDGSQWVRFSERFATAFKRRNIATAPEAPTAIANQNIPGAIYNTETGFYNSGFASTNGANIAGLATQGTQLRATFKNIPDGVSIRVSNRNTSGADQATIATSGTPLPWSSATGWTTLSQSGNQATAVWEIIGDNSASNDYVQFGVEVNYTPNQGAGLPSLDQATVAGGYAPAVGPTGASSSAPVPRFVDTGEDQPYFEIISCATNLLWPYVTNQAGFDTGMVISNTSMDPFGTVGQTGACTINYYGNSDGDAPPASQTTPDIGPGGYAIWSLYNGGGVKNYGEALGGMDIAATQGFEGYVIAQCAFQYAHGYAFVSDLGASKVAQGYVALILDEDMFGFHGNSSRTGSKSETLNQ